MYKYRDWPSDERCQIASGCGIARLERGAGFPSMMDMDVAIEAWVGSLIELNKLKYVLGAGKPWKPGEKLKLLFAGYNGTRNTGSDIRVEEIVRQMQRILGAENMSGTVMTQNFDLTRGYFCGSQQVHLPDVFPPFLHSEVPKHDGVVACEGSMFKSKFANALTAMIVGSLGIASAHNKLSVAYGGEAGAMDPLLQKMVKRYCHDSLVITRNAESQEILGKLGVATELGTDTAWTFQPLGPEYGRKALRDAGWDGSTPVLAICPINPFWWPVKPSLGKWLAHSLGGAYEKSYYRTIYFHRSGRDVDAAYAKYLSAMASGVQRYQKSRSVFPVLIAMEMLDRDACQRVSQEIGGAPIFSVRRAQHVRAGEHPARLRPHALVAVSRDRDLHARGRAFGGRHHGRAHSQSDAPARPRTSDDGSGRAGSGRQNRSGARRARR